MLSTMTVQITSLSQSLTVSRKILSNGFLKFSSYFKREIVEAELSYDAYGSAAVELINAGNGSTGVAVGYIDTVDNLPVFKIQRFIPTNLSSTVVEIEKDTADSPFMDTSFK